MSSILLTFPVPTNKDTNSSNTSIIDNKLASQSQRATLLRKQFSLKLGGTKRKDKVDYSQRRPLGKNTRLMKNIVEIKLDKCIGNMKCKR